MKILALWFALVFAVATAWGQQGGVAQVPVVEKCTPTLDHPYCLETWVAPKSFVVADRLTPHVDPEKPLKPLTKPPIHGSEVAVMKRPLNVVGKGESVVAKEVDKAGTSACNATDSCRDHHADGKFVSPTKSVHAK